MDKSIKAVVKAYVSQLHLEFVFCNLHLCNVTDLKVFLRANHKKI